MHIIYLKKNVHCKSVKVSVNRLPSISFHCELFKIEGKKKHNPAVRGDLVYIFVGRKEKSAGTVQIAHIWAVPAMFSKPFSSRWGVEASKGACMEERVNRSDRGLFK